MEKEKAYKDLNHAIGFTEIYKKHTDGDKSIRELECLKLQIPYVLSPMLETDIVAGFMEHGIVGFSPQYGGVYTYYYNKEKLEQARNIVKDEADADFLRKVDELDLFWQDEMTIAKLFRAFEEKHGFPCRCGYASPGCGNGDGRLAGVTVDLDKLIRLGLPGLKDEVKYAMEKDNSNIFLSSLSGSIDLMAAACKIYETQALDLIKTAKDENIENLKAAAEALCDIQTRAPASFLEGLQLMQIYAVVSDLMNYGRMDVYLGGLYAYDIDSGRITEEKAVEYILSLYRQFKRIGKLHDCRVIIGGLGRRNTENADRLALAIMEASLRFKDMYPQLTLRYYARMSEDVLDKALYLNAQGCTFPIIYSDETTVPAIMKSYNIPYEQALRWVPFGCGEYVLEGLSIGTPNTNINMLKALELALHDGYDPVFNVQASIKTGEPDSFKTFEELFEAVGKHTAVWVELLAGFKKMNYAAAEKEASFLLISLLMDDCIQKGKALLSGGVRYKNAACEVYGIISCADSLTAIKKLVFEDKVFTLSQLVNMLKHNWKGYEKERALFKTAPKYGNDDDYADEIAVKVFNLIADQTIEAGKKAGLNKYHIVSVNNSMSADWGVYCSASACGRYAGEAMSNGNGPSASADKNGLTALLNSMSKFDNTKHVGVINNVRLTKELFNSSYEKVKTLLCTFYKTGGVQTNLCVIDRNDLENAMREPEKYENLIVRIGGFSARFIDLNPVVQKELLDRTTYGR